ncbi:hypothetical protein ACQZV8_21105, partial [Magnetococcales bacterium HHB-1]
DINGDGYDDILVGVPTADVGGEANAGSSYVVFGQASGWSASVALSSLDGSNGFRVDGLTANDQSGGAVDGIGDFNGDGLDDFLVSASWRDPEGRSEAGESYIIYGQTSGWGASLSLSSIDGSNGLSLKGVDANDKSGTSAHGAGDINGDGFSDIIIGAPNGDPGNVANAGESYVVFGGNYTANNITVGTGTAETLTGDTNANVLIAGVGDDQLVGGGGADTLYGGAGDDTFTISDTTFQRIEGGSGTDTLILDGAGLSLDLTTLSDNQLTDIEKIDLTGSGNNTLTLNPLELLRLSSSSNTLRIEGDAGDVITGGNWLHVDSFVESGVTYERYLKGEATLEVNSAIDDSAFSRSYYDYKDLDGDKGFRVYGESNQGISYVSKAGDINGDGFDDFWLEGGGVDSDGVAGSGAAFILFGNGSNSWEETLDYQNLDGSNGFRVKGLAQNNYLTGHGPGGGDLNGDGL